MEPADPERAGMDHVHPHHQRRSRSKDHSGTCAGTARGARRGTRRRTGTSTRSPAAGQGPLRSSLHRRKGRRARTSRRTCSRLGSDFRELRCRSTVNGCSQAPPARQREIYRRTSSARYCRSSTRSAGRSVRRSGRRALSRTVRSSRSLVSARHSSDTGSIAAFLEHRLWHCGSVMRIFAEQTAPRSAFLPCWTCAM